MYTKTTFTAPSQHQVRVRILRILTEEQVRLVNLVRLQMDNFRWFLRKQTDK
jgi:hypothetical protein